MGPRFDEFYCSPLLPQIACNILATWDPLLSPALYDRGTMTIDEGAKSSVYAALLPPKTEVRGEFIHDDCSVKDWVTFRFKFEPSMMKPAPEEEAKK